MQLLHCTPAGDPHTPLTRGLQEALLHWRTKIATNSREWEERNRALRAEKDIMNRHYQVGPACGAQSQRCGLLVAAAAHVVAGSMERHHVPRDAGLMLAVFCSAAQHGILATCPPGVASQAAWTRLVTCSNAESGCTQRRP